MKIQPLFGLEDAVFQCGKAASESGFVAFNFGHTLTVALSEVVEGLQHLGLNVAHRFYQVVARVAHLRAKHLVTFIQASIQI
jgi:hypothetical protein